MRYSIEQSLDIIEQALDLTLSDEQRAILAHLDDKPMLINASAGSGKTATLIMAILVRLLTGKVFRPQEILGVTFSKNAQLNMEARYTTYAEQITAVLHEQDPDADVSALLSGSPAFRTFHSLFLSLVKLAPAYRNHSVITGYQIYASSLTPLMTNYDQDSDLSPYEYLDQLFAINTYVINHNLTLTGRIDDDLAQKLAVAHGLDIDPKTLADYNSVVAEYQEIKDSMHALDFNDMKILLYRYAQANPGSKAYHTFHEYIQPDLRTIKYAFIDEFQDIDIIQANLLPNILPQATFQRLIAIGDDDQCIYQFRGSNSDIIINFDKTLPDTDILPLSTNYRTGGNILGFAKNLIQHNVNRLAKNVKTALPDVGDFLIASDDIMAINQMPTENDPKNVYRELVKTAKADPAHTVVLTRRNMEAKIVADVLLLHDVVVNQSNSANIMENDARYAGIRDLAFGLLHDNLDAFQKGARYVGFRRYVSHIETVRLDNPEITTVRDYLLASYDRYDKKLEHGSMAHFNKQADKTIESALANVAEWYKDELNEQTISEVALNRIKAMLLQITAGYRMFMSKSSHGSGWQFEVILNHFIFRLAQADTLDPLVYQKQADAMLANTNTGETGVTVMTIHQAKGLEFKHVFVFGEDDRVVSTDMYTLYQAFHASQNKRDFFNTLKDVANNKAGVFDGGLQFDDLFSLINNMLTKRQGHEWLKFDPMQWDMSIVPFLCNDQNKLSERDQDLLNFLFTIIKGNNKTVEEERRLLYVAMTRAKQSLTIAKPVKDNPFFYELGIKLSYFKL